MPVDRIRLPSTAGPGPSAAERVVKALRDVHERIAIDLGRDDSLAPAWYLHLPSGAIFPIRFVSVSGSLVRFTGYDASKTECDYVLASPESVVVSIKSLPPDESGPRPIGFEWPPGESESQGGT